MRAVTLFFAVFVLASLFVENEAECGITAMAKRMGVTDGCINFMHKTLFGEDGEIKFAAVVGIINRLPQIIFQLVMDNPCKEMVGHIAAQVLGK